MPTQFPTAKKIVVHVEPQFELKDAEQKSLGLFRRMTPKEAATRPDAIRAMLGKKLTWFEQIATPAETDLYVSTRGV